MLNVDQIPEGSDLFQKEVFDEIYEKCTRLVRNGMSPIGMYDTRKYRIRDSFDIPIAKSTKFLAEDYEPYGEDTTISFYAAKTRGSVVYCIRVDPFLDEDVSHIDLAIVRHIYDINRELMDRLESDWVPITKNTNLHYAICVSHIHVDMSGSRKYYGKVMAFKSAEDRNKFVDAAEVPSRTDGWHASDYEEVYISIHHFNGRPQWYNQNTGDFE